MAKSKKLKVKKSDVGRWVTVRWDCVGRKDCLLVELSDDRKSGKVFEPHETSGLVSIEVDQITEIRDRLNAA